jgi:FkbM family methyltransferase
MGLLRSVPRQCAELAGRWARPIRARRASQGEGLPLAWRTVTHGPLLDAEFLLPPAGASPLADRIVAGTYEPEVVEKISDLARGGGHLYDIGAHVGVFECLWMAAGGTGVTAFEPLPYNAKLVRAVVARNQLANVTVLEVAVSDEDRATTVIADESSISTSSMACLTSIRSAVEREDAARFRNGTVTTVAGRRLDTVCGEHKLPSPTVIKIDVEGAEAHVVRGALTTLAAKPAIICELHSVDAAVCVAVELSRIGYKPSLLFHQKRTLSNYLWVSERLQQ